MIVIQGFKVLLADPNKTLSCQPHRYANIVLYQGMFDLLKVQYLSEAAPMQG